MQSVDQISLFSAFAAGILSFLSPCVLPLVPGYLGYVSGLGVEEIREHKQPREIIPDLIFNTIWFILGFTIVFVLMGAAATRIGGALMENRIWLTRAGGLLVFVFGLHMTHIFQIPFLNRMTQVKIDRETSGPIGATLLGASFSLGWTPCIGPILTTILTLASQQTNAGQGMLLLAVYSAGLGIPFLITGVLIGSFFGWYMNFRKHLHKIEIASGVMMMVLGTLLMSNKLGVLAQKLQAVLG